ncbi:MAG: arginine--tRNA ligase [Chlamydiota bacterium]
MGNLALKLQEKFYHAFDEAYPDLSEEVKKNLIEVTQSTQQKFGHYQCNSAMRFAKEVSENPRQIATTICENIDLLDSGKLMIANLEIAGPGFINILIDPTYLSDAVQKIFEDPHLGIERPEEPHKIVVDFSSPNIAKDMHVGHLRSTIIGDSLAHLFEFLGHDVLRLNHIGDWGTSFGMLIAYMKEHVPQVLEGSQQTDLNHLVSWYKESKQLFDADQSFKRRAQEEVVKLQSGNKEALKAWKIICGISQQAYQEIYDLLGVKIIDRGESYYNPVLPDIIDDLEDKGLITVSEGAKCIFLEGFVNREGDPLPLMVQKSDGGYMYSTTDLAAIRQRVAEEKADRIIYVTDAGQATHFKMVFAAAKKAGYFDPKQVQVDHVPFGLVLRADGKKFKTRSGETEKLSDLLYNAIARAKAILEEREHDIPADEVDDTAKALGIDAVKYADLSCNRTSDYTFSYDRMLRFEGNTAVFLMYSYVRVQGIKRKVGGDITEIGKSSQIKLDHISEVELGLHLCRFSEALEGIVRDLLPNRLSDYLYSLAEKFNAFYRDCRIEGSEECDRRLLLCEAVAKVMKQGFEILGLTTVERM